MKMNGVNRASETKKNNDEEEQKKEESIENMP